jgi:tetratricopeptide (TPR) repeat protein
LGVYTEAIKYYDKALEIDPKDANVWVNKAVALHKLEKYDEAIECYDKALEIDPEDSTARYDKWWAKIKRFFREISNDI